jgi:hypothetical protein
MACFAECCLHSWLTPVVSSNFVVQSNPELAPVFVDRSYSGNPRVAAGYFQVSSRH